MVAVVAVTVLLTGGGAATKRPPRHGPVHLTILSQTRCRGGPWSACSRRATCPIPDDDEADVTCSGRIPKPAHSVRRCRIHYPGGAERRIAVLTNARGAEVLSRP